MSIARLVPGHFAGCIRRTLRNCRGSVVGRLSRTPIDLCRRFDRRTRLRDEGALVGARRCKARARADLGLHEGIAWLPTSRLAAPPACGALCGGGEPKYVNPAAIRIGGASSTQELTASCGQMSLNRRLVESIGTIVHPPPPLQRNPWHPIDPMP